VDRLVLVLGRGHGGRRSLRSDALGRARHEVWTDVRQGAAGRAWQQAAARGIERQLHRAAAMPYGYFAGERTSRSAGSSALPPCARADYPAFRHNGVSRGNDAGDSTGLEATGEGVRRRCTHRNTTSFAPQYKSGGVRR